jgi:hypothetical protein
VEIRQGSVGPGVSARIQSGNARGSVLTTSACLVAVSALARSGYLIRDLASANPLLSYAQKPRTETEEKACSSERAKEAVR